MTFGAIITKEMLEAENQLAAFHRARLRGCRKPRTETRTFVAQCKSKVRVTYKVSDRSTVEIDYERLYCSTGCEHCLQKAKEAEKIIQKSIDNIGASSVM